MRLEPGIEADLKLDYPGFSLNARLSLPARGVTVFFGRSGSGKTSLFRCIAGLERAQGQLSVLGQRWQDDAFFLPTHQRPLGYVFQEASLFEHMTVLKNLHYGMKRVPQSVSKQAASKVMLDDLIDLLGIAPLLKRKPALLSGGERQRVAIARALAVNPQILMMDEPLAALDLEKKREILPYLERLHAALEIPILYITHSIDEVARLADHLVVLEQGEIRACGPLSEVLARLDLPIQVNDQLGVVLKAQIIELHPNWGLALARFEGGTLWVRDMGFKVAQSVRLRILARDVSLALQEPQQTSILNIFPARIQGIAAGDHPAVQVLQVQVGPSLLLALLTARSVASLELEIASQVWVQIKSIAIID